MTTALQIDAEVEARLQAEFDARFAAEREGLAMLRQLWEKLQPLRKPLNMEVDEGPDSEEASVWIAKTGLSKWTKRGRILLFTPAGREGPQALARTVDDAIRITSEFVRTGELPKAQTPRLSSSAPPPASASCRGSRA